jgi:flagellar motor switch protein FliM
MSEGQNLLSTEELDALAQNAPDAGSATDEGYNVGATVRKHELAAEHSTLGINTASLDMINERFIRLFRLGMLEVLRTSPRMNPSRVRIVRFSDYLKDLRPPLSVNIVRMQPLRGYSMVVIDPAVVFSSLDSFFGGFGKGVGQLPPGRMFTPTETRIIHLILQTLFRAQKEAWAPIAATEFELVSAEINPQFAQIADESDLVVLSRFEPDAAGQQAGGFIDIVVPYVALKPIRDMLRSRVQTGDGDEESDRAWRGELDDAVSDASVELRAILGKVHLNLHDLRALQPGDVLPVIGSEHARAMINNTPAFDISIGSRGSQMAVQILSPITPKTSDRSQPR